MRYSTASVKPMGLNALFSTIIVFILASTVESSTESEVVLADSGNRLFDNGTIAFAPDDDETRYELGDGDYTWKGIGHLAAGWVRQGVVRSVPPSDVIALVKDYMMEEEPDMIQTGKKVLLVEMPVVVTSFMLIVMAVIMPLVGLLFCCCRCSGRCGGTRREEDMASLSAPCGLIVALLLLTVCAFIGASSYATNPALTRIVDTLNHTSTVAKDIIKDAHTFKDDFIQDLERLAIDDFGFVLTALNQTLDDIGTEVASPLMVEMEAHLDDMSLAVEYLAAELTTFTSIGAPLDALLNKSANLILTGQSLQTSMLTAKGDLTTIRDDCLADPVRVAGGVCGGIPDPNLLDLGDVDFDSLSIGDLDLGTLRNDMDNALATIRGLLATGDITLQGLPGNISEASEPSIDGIRDVINQLQETVQGLVTDTTTSLNDMFDSLNLNSMEDTIDSQLQLPVERGTLILVISVLPLAFCLMVVFTLIGMLLGLCGCAGSCGAPRRRGCPIDCGGKMMMGSVCWSFTASIYICLVAAIFLVIGSTLTIVCDSLLDLSFIKEIVDDDAIWGDNNPISSLSFGNSTLNITVFQILEDCENDETLFTALDLGSSGILDLVLDLDLRQMLPDLSPVYDLVNETVSSLDIMPSGQADELLSQLTGQLSPNNISEAVTQISSGLDPLDLVTLIDNLNMAADAVDGSYSGMATDLRTLAADLVVIDTQHLQAAKNLSIVILEDVQLLNSSIQYLEGVSGGVSLSIAEMAGFISNEAGPLVIQSLNAYIEGILGLADQFIFEVLRRIEEDIGKCGIIRNIYDAVVGTVCEFFLPGLNVFWFAVSFIAFALVPNIIFNVRLAKYMRRPTHPALPEERAPFDGVAVYPPSTSGAGTSQGAHQWKQRLSNSLVNIKIDKKMLTRLKGNRQ